MTVGKQSRSIPDSHMKLQSKSNVDFWKTKLFQTKERDRKQIENIQKIGWKVGIIWECALKNPEDIWALVELNINSHEACWQI